MMTNAPGGEWIIEDSRAVEFPFARLSTWPLAFNKP